jgi:soluble lytic murein transglycosylase
MGAIALVLGAIVAYFLADSYWTHRYDEIIKRQASIYRLDERLVWSVIHEETYFQSWKTGADGEIGLMQITPAVVREWAKETGLRELEKQAVEDPESVLRHPEKNIQVGCWYLEKLYEKYRDLPGTEARMLAAYNAGPSRAEEWGKTNPDSPPLSEEEFISRINIGSTRAYVRSILNRYRALKTN